jgi:hypothetical protein
MASDEVEILLLDSSPNPATCDLARGYSSRMNIRILECRNLPTWMAKTNAGVEMASSEHVCLLHQDDLWLPNRMATIRVWIHKQPEAVLHLAPSAFVDRTGRLVGVWHCPLPANNALEGSVVKDHLLVQNFIAIPAPVFRKDAWLACRGLDEELWYTADWDIWLKLAARGPVLYHNVVTTGFRIHADSLTVTGSRDATDFRQQMQVVLDRHMPQRRGTLSTAFHKYGDVFLSDSAR